MSNVKMLKMVSHDDLVAEVVGETDTTIMIKNPIRVILVPNRAGTDAKTPTVAFSPYLEFAEENQEVTIAKAHVICIVSPIREFVNQYNSLFGKLLVPQKARLVIP